MMEARGAGRQLAVGRRFDLETPVARHTTGARIVVADPGAEIDVAAAINRGLHLLTPAEAPFAFDHRIGASMPLMMMGTPGRPGITMSKPPPARAGSVVPIQIASAKPARIGFVRPVSHGNLTDRASLKVKAKDQNSGKPNARAWMLAQLQAMAIRKC